MGINMCSCSNESEAEKLNEQYCNLFNHARDIILVIHNNGKILKANESAIKMYGYTKTELQGMNFNELLLPEKLEQVNSKKNSIKKTDSCCFPERFNNVEGQFGKAIIEGHMYEMLHRCKNGAIVSVEINMTLSDFDGEQVIFTVIRDITKRRQTEQEKMERTGEIALSEKKASLTTVAAGIAHEVNNPLTFIKMNAQVLDLMIERQYRSEDPIEISIESYKRSLDAIVRGTERIADIVNGLKFFARQELREKTAVNLCKVLEDAWAIVETNQTLLKKIQLDRTVDSEIMVYGNSQQIEQILINLLNNAIKAIYKAGKVQGSISINAYKIETETEWVVLKLTDNGCGMEYSVISRIFEPFYTSDNEMGTGMGLAVVQGIIDEHGGTIAVESAPGQGTTFTIRLPAYGDEEGAQSLEFEELAEVAHHMEDFMVRLRL